jgi:hypothetical protein
VKFTLQEFAAVEEAAGRAGLAVSAWIGQTVTDAAELRTFPVGQLQREMLAELIRSAGLVRRAGVDLNQAVTRLNTTGTPGPDLEPAARFCLRVVERVDQAAELVRRRM